MLTQAEADQFMAMAKYFLRPPAYITIPPGADDTYELASPDNREKFPLDIWRGTIRLSKFRLQNRVRIAIVMVDSMSMVRLIRIPMGSNSLVHTCTSLRRVTRTSGPTQSTRANSLC